MGWDLHNMLQALSPFGMGNEKPIFLFRGVTILAVLWFGKSGAHVKLLLDKGNGRKIAAIQFFAKGIFEEDLASEGATVDIIGHVEKDMFAGRPALRIRMLDIRQPK